MATVDIYGMGPSAPCRILYMTCTALGVEYNDIAVDLMKGENKTPEYLKVRTTISNPFCNSLRLVTCDYIISHSNI